MTAPTTIQEHSAIVGTLVAEMYGPDGELKGRCKVKNLITTAGDEVITRRAAGIATMPAAPTGMRIGTDGTAAAKAGTGAALIARVTGGNKGFDSGYPQWSQNGSAARVTWRTSYNAGEGTSGTSIAEAVLVNDTISSDVATGAANTVARAALTGLGIKGASDILILTWTWDHTGT